MKYDVFIIYETFSGKDLAEHLKDGLRRININAFVATQDIPLGEDEIKVRYSTLKEVNHIILIVTHGIFHSKEVKAEIKEAVRAGKKENIIPFVYDGISDEEVKNFFNECNLGNKQWNRFSQDNSKEDLTRKVLGWYSKNSVRSAADTSYSPIAPPEVEPQVFTSFSDGLKLMEEYKWDDAIGEFRKALKQAKGHEMGAIFNLIGICYYITGRLKEALDKYELSLILASELEDGPGEANALGNIGFIYQMRGELDRALEYYAKAKGLNEGVGNRMGVAININNIGLVYQVRGELDNALRCFEEALGIYKDIGSRPGEANALGNIGFIYQMRGELDRALEYYAKAKGLNEGVGNRMGVAININNIGLVYQVRGELNKALECFSAALKIFKEIGTQREIKMAENNIQALLIIAGTTGQDGHKR
ncbi:toll/interleukin-1 receptor domain-containing protein [candidate division WOR-3 bacterium]|nr:toll/interleukin-1 receptor domain-containing protein [candidate division WOR-3 bacterium]